jgi:hypothetical protein
MNHRSLSSRARLLASCLAGATLTLGLGATGCGGGLAPGDYVLLRVAFSQEEPTFTCFPNDDIPPSVSEDVYEARQATTFILYRGANERFYLDAGLYVVEGTGDGSAFEFKGESVDVSYLGGGTIFDSDHDGIDDSEDDFVDSDGDGIADFEDPDVDVDMDGEHDLQVDALVDADGDGEDDRYVELTGDTALTTTRDTTISLKLAGDVVSGTLTSRETTACDGTSCMGFDAFDCTRTRSFTGARIDTASLSVD